MPDFAFVTSLRARALAADWHHHVALLERTVNSFLAQSDPEIAVVIVCHDRPALKVRDPRVHITSVDFPLPRREFDDMTVDKVLKVSIGAQWAIDHGCRFLMYADADDLVSRRLAAHARQHRDANGWFFADGYAHQYGRPWVSVSANHDQRCGTCAVFRTDALSFAHDPLYRGGWVESVAAFGHTGYREIMAGAGRPLAPLPFPGSVYIQHSDSIVTTREPFGPGDGSALRRGLRAVRDAGRRASRLRPLTPALAREFTIVRSAL